MPPCNSSVHYSFIYATLATAAIRLGVISATALCLLSGLALGQRYPDHPVRLVVPFAPGGINDVLARIVASELGERLGQRVVIENRPGAGGTIGSNLVAKSAADGYILLFGATSTIAVSPSLYADRPYDPVKDFEPITLVASVPSVLVVHPSLRVASMRDLIALARDRPGLLNFGSAGAGTSQHLGGELLKTMAGVAIVHVPYKGGAPAMADLVAGHIALMIEPLATALPQIRAGTVKAIAVSTLKRVTTLPHLPTIAETLAGFDLTVWSASSLRHARRKSGLPS